MKLKFKGMLWAAAAASMVGAAGARAALSPGDIAIIGWNDSATPDVYSIVALAPIPQGEVIYFTDNGWTGTQFRGASATDGDGNENLTKFTAASIIAAGTVFTSYADSQWATSGSIAGTTSGSFASNALSTSGDQVYAFQSGSPESNPLFNPTGHLFVLDDTGAFENAAGTNDGNVTPGLSTAANTAVTFTQNSTGQNGMIFNTAVLASGTKEEWLAAITNSANWTFGGNTVAQPSGSIVVVTPEPASLGLLGVAALGLVRRNRRSAR